MNRLTTNRRNGACFSAPFSSFLEKIIIFRQKPCWNRFRENQGIYPAWIKIIP